MKIKLQNGEILEVLRICGENNKVTTFEKMDRSDITINNEDIIKIQFNDGSLFIKPEPVDEEIVDEESENEGELLENEEKLSTP